jgi:hypothetical protein
MNSPDYYTVYPPVLQSVFLVAAPFASFSPLGGVVVLRLCILAAEGFRSACSPNCWPRTACLPAGSAVRPQPAGDRGADGQRALRSPDDLFSAGLPAGPAPEPGAQGGPFLALSAGVKLLPLLFLPLVLAGKGWKTTLRLGAWTAFFFGLCWLPFFRRARSHLFEHQPVLQTFEFNAGVYYLLREAGYRIHGYNVIGTLGPCWG